jgi:hypothetical protein
LIAWGFGAERIRSRARFSKPSDYPIREAEDEERTKNEIHNERKSGVQRSG